MTREELRGRINALLLFAIVLSNALQKTAIGGEDSIYNTITFALIIAVILFNPRFNPIVLVAFSVPLVFVALSLLSNAANMGPANFRSALATAAGYMVFGLSEISLSQRLTRRLLSGFLIISLIVSVAMLIIATNDDGPSALLQQNANFNVNPNSAALFFVFCLITALVLVQSRIKWLYCVGFALLVITTQSRGGIVCAGFALFGYGFLGSEAHVGFRQKMTERTRMVILAVAVIASVGLFVFPDLVDLVTLRFANAGTGRDEVWQAGLAASQSSLATILVGTGPATLEARIGRGSHSAYIQAAGSLGYPFLLTSLFAVFIWARSIWRSGRRDIAWVAACALVYGVVETVLFSGTGIIWFGLALAGMCLQSRDTDTWRQRAYGFAPARPVMTPRRLSLVGAAEQVSRSNGQVRHGRPQ